MYHVYILYSQMLDRYYVGYTEDLDKRLNEHNSGMSSYTSKAKDWQLRFKQSFDSRENAIAREREIKNKKSRKYIEWIIRVG